MMACKKLTVSSRYASLSVLRPAVDDIQSEGAAYTTGL